MDEDTPAILRSLGLEELIQIFEDNSIDKEALHLLGEDELKELIPKVGPRMKLKKYLKSIVQDRPTFPILHGETVHGGGELESTTGRSTEQISDTDITDTELRGAGTADECPRNSESLDGRAILKEGEIDKGLLKEGSRRKIAQVVIHHILEKNPTKQIRSEEFQTIATEIVEIFPRESVLVFYSAYVSAVDITAKKNASGKLYESYINRRRKLREKGELAGHRRSASCSISRSSSTNISSSPTASLIVDDFEDDDHSTSNNENLIWLRNNVDPWKTVEEKWKETADCRHECFKSGKGAIADYFKEFPALKQPEGYTLLMDDFCRQYPGKENSLFSMIILKREEIVEYAKKKVLKIRANKDVRTAINNIIGLVNEDDPETTTNVALLLLAHVVNISPTRRQKGRQPWKPSRAEICDGFIQVVASEANVTETIITKREKYLKLGRTLQPFIINVGQNIVETSAVYVVVDDTVYKFNKLVTAVDCAFKIYQATGACYTEEAADVWLFLQVGFYNIKTKYDRRTQAVNTLLTDLGVLSPHNLE